MPQTKGNQQRHVLEQEKKKKPRKSRRRKLLYWLLIDLAVAAIVIGLLLYKPSQYNPVISTSVASDGERVHPYLHRDLGSTLYNGAQRQRPFDMTVHDTLLNEAIALAKWPQQAEGVTFYAPEVLFRPGRIVLMGTADLEGAKFVITIELEPEIDEQHLLSINVAKIKVGAMNITPLAKMMARRMYQQRLETVPIDTEALQTKIAASLLNQEPFEPVFEVDDKWVRLQSIEITEGKLVARLVPAI